MSIDFLYLSVAEMYSLPENKKENITHGGLIQKTQTEAYKEEQLKLLVGNFCSDNWLLVFNNYLFIIYSLNYCTKQ